MDLTTLANYLHENSLIDEEDYFEKVSLSFSLSLSLSLCSPVVCSALLRWRSAMCVTHKASALMCSVVR
jgi:hypothetical protein